MTPERIKEIANEHQPVAGDYLKNKQCNSRIRSAIKQATEEERAERDAEIVKYCRESKNDCIEYPDCCSCKTLEGLANVIESGELTKIKELP